MKNVLILYYSQSGQLQSVMDQIVAPLLQCDYRKIEPVITVIACRNMWLIA